MQSLWMLLASLLFACMGVCVKLAAAAHSASEITFWRCAVALILMFGLVRWRGVRLRTPHWRWQITRGTVGFSALFLYFHAITLLPLATAVTLNYTSAIFLALYMALTGWRVGRGVLFSLGLGLAGVALLLHPTLSAGQLWGALLGLLSGALAGMAYFSVRELGARGESETRTVFYFSLISTVYAGLWLLFAGWSPISLESGLLLLGTGCFATFAQLAMTRAFARGKTLVAAAIAYSTVIFSSLFGMWFWDEKLDASAWTAIGLIVLSGVAATHFSRANPLEQD
ncbi:MAG: DMT family transporter [Azonexus sp.]|jgi:S-adenosylmethionine uptake transporter|nr:DMT family transporter [Azonexus sp.]